MKSWLWSILFAATFAILWATGLMSQFFGWCESHIGGWFVPVMIIVMALVVITPPIARGFRAGVRRANGEVS